jgi:hemerythrin-like domain-containing protein
MDFSNRVCQALHDEHFASIALMERLEQAFARYRKTPPDVKDQVVAQLLNDLTVGIEGELTRHFAFEEEELFSYLNAAGDRAIGAHLTSEHEIMRPLGAAVVKLIGEARAQGFDEKRWNDFRRLGQELSERLVGHAQKEEMALLPMLNEMMDSEKEMQLYEKYVENT